MTFSAALASAAPIKAALGGGGFDPLSALSSVPSFTGGAAGPSFARSDGQQYVNTWMNSPFAVGPGARADAKTPVAIGPGFAGASPVATQIGPLVIAGLGLLVVVFLFKGRR